MVCAVHYLKVPIGDLSLFTAYEIRATHTVLLSHRVLQEAENLLEGFFGS